MILEKVAQIGKFGSERLCVWGSKNCVFVPLLKSFVPLLDQKWHSVSAGHPHFVPLYHFFFKTFKIIINNNKRDTKNVKKIPTSLLRKKVVKWHNLFKMSYLVANCRKMS